MGRIAVNQIRRRLGRMVNTIFNAEFAERYAAVCSSVTQNVNFPSPECTKKTEELIQKLSLCLDSEEKIAAIISEATDESLVQFFLRYHVLTQQLNNRDQNEFVIVADEDESFFRQMFEDFWKVGLSI